MCSAFVCIDVETANPHPGSICSVGCARFEGDQLTNEFYRIVNPKEYFSPQHTAIHGIGPDDVRDAPSFLELLPGLDRFIGGLPLIHHTHFDRTAVQRACDHWGISPPRWSWFDSAGAARSTWAQFRKRGYGLGNLCAHIGYEFKHHHALEDAKASGAVIIAAMREHDASSFDELRERLELPAQILATEDDAVGEDRKGPLSGEVIVLSGSFSELGSRLQHRTLRQRAEALGARVTNSVTRKTTMLVAGSAQARAPKALIAAKRLQAEGHPLQIMNEYDFKVLCTPERRTLL